MRESKRTELPEEPAKSRAAAGHTQAVAAALLDVSPRTWQDWERGVNPMSPQLLRLYRHLAGLERIPFRSVSISRLLSRRD